MNWYKWRLLSNGGSQDINLVKVGRGKYAYPPEKASEAVHNARRLFRAGGFSRIMSHLLDGIFAIVAAKKPEKTLKQNMDDYQALKARILQDGHGFYPATGWYKGIPEDSLFIPGLSLEGALEYGRLFDPPQDEVMWGQGGQYGFYRVESGKISEKGIRNVKDDFTFLREGEMEKLKGEEVGLTEVKRKPHRPFSTDPEIKKLREKWRDEQVQEMQREQEAKPVVARYLLITDPRYHLAMGNYEGILKVASIDVSQNTIRFDEQREASIRGMLAILPWEEE